MLFILINTFKYDQIYSDNVKVDSAYMCVHFVFFLGQSEKQKYSDSGPDSDVLSPTVQTALLLHSDQCLFSQKEVIGLRWIKMSVNSILGEMEWDEGLKAPVANQENKILEEDVSKIMKSTIQSQRLKK